MPSCELSIKLAEPTRIYRGGEHVKGVVEVRADKDVKCNALKIATIWETHGRGNIDCGKCEETIVFEGHWQAGEQQQYEFSLPCAGWPPTYHGGYLNIDHYVYAQADIPWALDPKEKQPFRVVPSPQGDGQPTKVSQPTELTGMAAWLVGGIFFAMVAVFLVIFIINPFFWGMALLMMGIGGTWWFFARFLPKWRLGAVKHSLESDEVRPGQVLKANLAISPQGNVPINGIYWRVKSQEVCVKGSGTNKTTHRKVLAEYEHRAVGATTLAAGQQHTFQLEYPLPTDAPYSIDLGDNDLTWSAEVRVDIPRWPDWHDTQSFSVRPTEQASLDAPETVADGRTAQPSVSFVDTMSLIAKVRDDFEQLDRVIEGVAGLEFDINAYLERPISVGNVDSDIGYPDGVVIEANYPDRHVPLLLYASPAQSQELANHYRRHWRGRGTIVGYDRRIGSLQIRLLDV